MISCEGSKAHGLDDQDQGQVECLGAKWWAHSWLGALVAAAALVSRANDHGGGIIGSKLVLCSGCTLLSMAVWEIFRLRLITSPWLEINGHVGVGGWRAEFRLRSVSGVGFGLWQRFYDVIGISPGLGSGLGVPDKQTSVAVSARFGTTTNKRGEAQIKGKLRV